MVLENERITLSLCVLSRTSINIHTPFDVSMRGDNFNYSKYLGIAQNTAIYLLTGD